MELFPDRLTRKSQRPSGKRERRRGRALGQRDPRQDLAAHVEPGAVQRALDKLLALLAQNADRVLTHRAILKAVWGPNAVNQPEHLWVLVGQLRKKIEVDPAHPRYLVSEPWVGYRLATDTSQETLGTS